MERNLILIGFLLDSQLSASLLLFILLEAIFTVSRCL